MIVGHTVMFRDGTEGTVIAVDLGEYEIESEIASHIKVKVTGFIGLIMLSDHSLTSRTLEGAMVARNILPERHPPTRIPGPGEGSR